MEHFRGGCAVQVGATYGKFFLPRFRIVDKLGPFGGYPHPPVCGIYFPFSYIHTAFRTLFNAFYGQELKTPVIKTEKILIGAAVALGLYWVWQKYNAIKLIQFAPGPIGGMSFIGSSPVLSVSLMAANTSPSDLTVNSVSGSIVANNIQAGSIYNFTPVILPANSQVAVPVTIQLSLSAVANDIIKAFSSGTYSQDIALIGSANLEGLQVPFNLNFKIGT